MNRFQKDLFAYDGGYLTYGPERTFVARFKHHGPMTKARMIAVLCKHYDPASYFIRLRSIPPLEILREDGILTFDRETNQMTLDGKPL